MKIPAFHRVKFRNGITMEDRKVRSYNGTIVLTSEAGIREPVHEYRVQVMRGYADWTAPQNKPISFVITGANDDGEMMLLLFDYDCHERNIDDLGLISEEEALTHKNEHVRNYGLSLCSTNILQK